MHRTAGNRRAREQSAASVGVLRGVVCRRLPSPSRGVVKCAILCWQLALSVAGRPRHLSHRERQGALRAEQSNDKRILVRTRGGTSRRGVTAFYARRSPAPSIVPHRAAAARRLGQAPHRTLHKRQTVIVGCREAGYLRACVALKPSGGAGLSKGQRGNIRKFPLAPWKTTPFAAASYPTKLKGCKGFNICQNEK